MSISPPRGRPSWALAGFNLFRSPLNRVPGQQNYTLYHSLRETVPIINAAITKTAEFVGCPSVDAEPETKQEIEAWLEGLHVNRLQTGWKNWLSTWLSNSLEYGRAHTEIVLTADQKDVYALLELHPATISLRPTTDGYSVEVVQNQALTQGPVRLNPLLLLNAVHNVMGDDPNGTSLLWGLPFVAEIIVKMTNALGQTWDRFGVPTYHVNWLPPEGFSDPTGASSTTIMADMQANFTQAMISRREQDIRDFFTSGTVTVSIVGAQGEQLDFETPMRTLTEQVVAATGIPPFVFGLQWATTERMSAVQAALLSEMIHNLRAEISGEITYLIKLRQTLSGGDTEFSLCWPAPTLLDDMDTAKAQLFSEQARTNQITNAMKLWQEGFSTVYDVAREVRPDLADLDDAQINQRLPDLPLLPPPVAAPAVLPPGGQPGGGNAPLLNAALMELLAPSNGKDP